ncbi:hypothetical protein [Enterococcus italicus]|uniref:hypothetical protein n=1 Tax=Enterococcus italicus TaxID=246144 RepID=UPI0020746870|nr:hypothetical protein [Enterococcus italicus]
MLSVKTSTISKKNIFQGLMIIIALYLCFTSILISVSLPEDIVTSSVEKIRQFINILGGIGASYLVLVVIFSNSFEKLFVHTNKNLSNTDFIFFVPFLFINYAYIK